MNLNTPVVSAVIKNYKYSRNAFLSKEILIPLTQENGISYKALVKPGDIVKEGEIIAESNSLTETVYIHSSMPGTGTEICPCYSFDGKQDFCIKIKFGGALSYLGKKNTESSIEYISSASIVPQLIEKGVINTFYTSSPENLGLQIKNHSEYKNLVVRLFDEDVYRVTDSLVSKLYFEQIVKGSEVLAKAINAPGIIFAIDQKLEDKSITEKVNLPNSRFLEMNIRRYPSGTPREIVSAFRRSGMKKNCNFEITKHDLFVDAYTCYEVYKAVICGIPSISRLIHFSGNCLYSSCLLDVKIGTPIIDIVNQLGGFIKTPAMVLLNGALSGTSVQSLNTPVSRTTKSVEFVSYHKKTDTQLYSCGNCCNCRFVCPVKISPDILYNNTVNFKLLPENFAASSIACIGCGLCNTVCPSRLPLSQTIKYIKENLQE